MSAIRQEQNRERAMVPGRSRLGKKQGAHTITARSASASSRAEFELLPTLRNGGRPIGRSTRFVAELLAADSRLVHQPTLGHGKRRHALVVCAGDPGGILGYT